MLEDATSSLAEKRQQLISLWAFCEGTAKHRSPVRAWRRAADRVPSELSVAFITSVPPQGWWEDKPPVDKPDDAVRKTQEPLLSRDAAPRVVR